MKHRYLRFLIFPEVNLAVCDCFVVVVAIELSDIGEFPLFEITELNFRRVVLATGSGIKRQL